MAKAGANVGRRIHGRHKSKDNAAGKRGGVCSIAVCGQHPLPGRRNGKIAKSSGPSRRKSGFSLKRRGEIRCIEQSGVRKQISIGA